jgi:hypothetical protein
MAGTLLIVEGAHDATFFGKLIERKGFNQLKTKAEIPAPWVNLVPKGYPFENDRLDRISPVPDYYLRPDGHVFCIASAGGDGGIIARLKTITSTPLLNEISAIGLVIDADKQDSAQNRFIEYRDQIDALNKVRKENLLPLPQRIGDVFAGSPKIGIHVFPNNADPGALETVLLECAQSNAPHLHDCADNTVKKIVQANPKGRDFKKLRKPMGPEKATAGIIANLLYPGASLASSLKSDVWLRGDALNHPAVQQADAFLQALL